MRNPFYKLHLDECCGMNDILHPETNNYIFFINGIAYATDGYILAAISLQDLEIDLFNYPIEQLEGRKIHRIDFKILSEKKDVYFEDDGIIRLYEEGTIQLHMPKIEVNDTNYFPHKILNFCKIMKEDLKNKKAIHKIKINLKLIERMSKMFEHSVIARFRFVGTSPQIFVEFEKYRNSYGLIMPMIDIDDENK